MTIDEEVSLWFYAGGLDNKSDVKELLDLYNDQELLSMLLSDWIVSGPYDTWLNAIANFRLTFEKE